MMSPSKALPKLRKYAPGVDIVFLIALAMSFLGDHYDAPVMLFALLIGMAFSFLAEEGPCADGVALVSKRCCV